MDRIKLAEAMGWKHKSPSEGGITDKKLWHWEISDPDKRIAWYPHQLPDPFTNANDCEALIRWLNEHGWIVRISIGPDAADVWIETLANECHDWSGNDWKQGVCELALKVIDRALSEVRTEDAA